MASDPTRRSQRLVYRTSVLLAKAMALPTLTLCFLTALGLLIGQAVRSRDWASILGYLIYCAVTLMLARDIYRARAADPGTDDKHPQLPTLGVFTLLVLVIDIVVLMVFSLPGLTFGAFHLGALMYSVAVSLLAWGTFRAGSISGALILFLLAAVGFVALTGGLLQSDYKGPPTSDGPQGAALEDLVVNHRKEHKLVGLAAMVMVDGNVMACAADGERKFDGGVPIALGDRWHLGSITKSVTATMMARLVESGQMKWTDTIGERFSDASIDEEWKPVTLHQLLTHTAGAPANFSSSVMVKRPLLGSECTRERRLAVIEVLEQKPAHRPGETFAYSNVGYTIAGAMAESVTGLSWEDLVTREVFEPLQLVDAGFGPPKSRPESLDQPRGHRRLFRLKASVSEDDDNTPIMGPAGTTHMTLANLCRFAMEHLRGDLGDSKFLDPETFKMLHTPQREGYACGRVVKSPAGELPVTTYWRNGSNTMWYALVVFIPEKNMVVAVTSNDGDMRAAESAAWKIVNASVKRVGREGDAAPDDLGPSQN